MTDFTSLISIFHTQRYITPNHSVCQYIIMSFTYIFFSFRMGRFLLCKLFETPAFPCLNRVCMLITVISHSRNPERIRESGILLKDRFRTSRNDRKNTVVCHAKFISGVTFTEFLDRLSGLNVAESLADSLKNLQYYSPVPII